MASEEHSLPPSTTFPGENTMSQHSLPPSATFPLGNTASQPNLPISTTFPGGNTSLPPSDTFPLGNTASHQHSLPPSTTFPGGNTSRHSLLPPSTAIPGGNTAIQENPTTSTTFEVGTEPGQDDIETIKKEMFKDAMKGMWSKVVEAYKKHPMTQDHKITRSGETALHIAILNGEVEIVQQLVEHINESKTLCEKNDRENTPLHLAAALGMVEMCTYIVDKYYRKYPDNKLEVMGARNKDGETPLFLSALHGHKDAFLCLHSYYPEGDGSLYRRKSDGDTILHVAIKGEYFDLAYQIIKLHKELVNFNNEKGISPLHILASNPSAFKSGSRLGRFDLIIYHCIFVDELKEWKNPASDKRKSGEGKCSIVPENYRTCQNFFLLFYYLIEYFFGLPKGSKKSKQDMENPKVEVKPTPAGGQSADVSKGSSAGTSDDKSTSAKVKDQTSNKKDQKATPNQFLPPNYITFLDLFKLVMKTLLVILGLGISRIEKIREKKEKHTWAFQIMEELVELALDWEPEAGRDPKTKTKGDPTLPPDPTVSPLPLESNVDSSKHKSSDPNNSKHRLDNKGEGKMETPKVYTEKMAMTDMTETILNNFPVGIQDMISDRKNIVLLAVENSQPETDKGKKDTPILVAAKMGVAEMIEKILNKFPVAIQDTNSDRKNVVLLAVESRQPHVYKLLMKRKILRESVFRKLDKDGNSALHLAATLGQYRPWLIPGAALQMQWEIKWYQFVKTSMPPHFFVRHNHKGMTPKEVFTNTHKDLVKDGGEWLTNTSQSCSVVAALIATVAFATAATVPGGVKQDTGAPTFENEPAFDVFAISSLVALCFSVTAMIMFLSILTSRYQEKDFGNDLPNKLIMGLSSLFISIASMLVSFCAGHFFVLKDKLKYAAYPVYAVTCLPVTFFAVAQFPLYVDLIRSTFKNVPQRSYKVVPV